MAIKDYVVNTISDLQGVIKDIHRSPDLRLGDILVEERLISREQLNEALVRQRHGKGVKHLGQILIDMQLVNQDEVNAALARELGIPLVNLLGFELPSRMLAESEAIEDLQLDPVGASPDAADSVYAIEQEAQRKPIVRLVNAILVQGVTRGASDMNIRPEKDRVNVYYRIDGQILYAL